MTIKLKQLLHTSNEETLQTHDLDGENDQGLATADYGLTDGGLWVPKKVTDDGKQKVQQTGSILALDENGDPIELQAEEDGEGGYALRVIPSRVAYDESEDEYKTRNKGQIISRTPKGIRSDLNISGESGEVEILNTDKPIEIINFQWATSLNNDTYLYWEFGNKRLAPLQSDGTQLSYFTISTIKENQTLFELKIDNDPGGVMVLKEEMLPFRLFDGVNIRVENIDTDEQVCRVLMHYYELELA